MRVQVQFGAVIAVALIGIEIGAGPARPESPLVTRERIGQSVTGSVIEAVRISPAGVGADIRRPTLVIVAGLDGRHVTGPLVADQLIAKLSDKQPESLTFADLVIVPRVNPDGIARFSADTSNHSRFDTGTNQATRKTARDDADHDRRIDEDGPMDLNGDGLITQMRLKKPLPAWLRNAAATEILEPDDPRLMKSANASKGEKGEYAIITEGKDQDGDGLIAEDGPEGVDLESNFPYHWPESDASAGPSPLSEPESRAVADWLLAHPEVVAVLEYAPNDNLINIPAPTEGKFDATGEAPQSGRVLDEDRQWFELVSNKFKEATQMKSVGGMTRSFDGSLQGWTYAQLGIAAFVNPGWTRPEPPKAEEKKDDQKKDETKKEKKYPDTEDGRWLAYSDSLVAAGKTPGFVDWKPFHHPQLGDIEIGGWRPGFKLNPSMDPDADITRVANEQAKFVGDLLGLLPRFTVAPIQVERIGNRLWRIRATATNDGSLPTRTAMGSRTRRLPNTRWEVDLPLDRVASGARTQGTPSVAPGGQLAGEWVVTGDSGSDITIKLLSPETGDREIKIKLEAAAEGEVKK